YDAAHWCALLSVVTGELHEDGFDDMVDGCGGGRDREDVLAIMRDSRIGTFGVMALVLVFIAKAASLGDFAGKVAEARCLGDEDQHERHDAERADPAVAHDREHILAVPPAAAPVHHVVETVLM